jgi:CarboxypepD_reg-like domain
MLLKALLSNGFILVLLSTQAVSQQVLTGKVRQKSTDAILASVTVVNHTQRKYNVSDAGGNYRIFASPGDTLTFSSAGYHADTTVVGAELQDKDGYIVYLEPNMVELPSVLIGQ